jgi:ankyrin repeat protein
MKQSIRLLTRAILTLGVVCSTLPARADRSKYQKLAYAIFQDQVDVVKAMLGQGLNPNARVVMAKEDEWAFKNWDDPAPPLLILASHFGSPQSKIVQLLLDHGANVHLRDKQGRTALFFAGQLGWTWSVEMLLKKGADVNVKDKDGKTPPMWAMGNRNQGAVELLIEKGARINDKDNVGRSALMFAISDSINDPIMLFGTPTDHKAEKERHIALVQYLIDKGADVNVRDRNGETALTTASYWRLAQIVEMLKKAGARE